MRKTVFLVGVILISSTSRAQYNVGNRQRNQSQQSSNKLYFGMGGGFGVGTNSLGVNYNYYSLLPLIGYRVTNQVSVGATFTYQRYNYPTIGTSFTQYGFGPFVRYSFNPLFLQAEYDVINAPDYNAAGELVRSDYSRMLFGVGYVFVGGKRLSLGGLVMYDILYHVPSVFNSPLVTRVYVSF
jgi:hypothetical protein